MTKIRDIDQLIIKDILCEVEAEARIDVALHIVYNLAREKKCKVSLIFNGTYVEVDATKDWDMDE